MEMLFFSAFGLSLALWAVGYFGFSVLGSLLAQFLA